MRRKNIRGKPIMISKIREIFRLHYDEDICNEKISHILSCSKGSVFNYLNRLEKSTYSYLQTKEISDQELIEVLRNRTPFFKKCEGFWPDFDQLIDELTRPHVTCQLLWEEYLFENPKGIKRTKFFTEISKRLKKVSPSQRMSHKGGEKLFLDYTGSKLEYIDVESNKIVEVEAFVASFGASSYTYVECTHSQKTRDWNESHIGAFEFFNGIPKYLVPDNLKSAVIVADSYNPIINESYKRLASYYDTIIMPARSRKPQDKAVVEANVKAVQNFIFPRLRDQTFTSLAELNLAVRDLLEIFNNKEMQEYKCSRRDRFIKLDQEYLAPLNPNRFEYAEFKLNVTVNKTYHVLYQNHYYSVPFQEISNKVEIRDSGMTIEIYRSGERLAAHKKGLPDRTHTTLESHMPSNHKFQSQFGYDFVCKEAEKIGPSMLEAVKKIMGSSDASNEYLSKKAYSLVVLQKDYNLCAIEKAVKYILHFTTPTVEFLKSTLDQNLANEIWEEDSSEIITIHSNIRGAAHYQQKEIGEKIC